MKGLIAFLSVIATLVVGLCFGTFLAERNSNYKLVNETANVEGKQDASQEDKENKEDEKKEVETTKEEKVEKQEPKKEEKYVPKPNTNTTKKVKEKEYDVYYYLVDFISEDSKIYNYMALDMIYMYYDSNYPNDYYIVNDNPKLRTYKISENVRYRLWDYKSMRLVDVDTFDFLKYTKQYTILDVKIKGDTIVSVEEVYVP